MKEAIRNRLTKENIVTIPNMLSFFRLLLIPAILILYCAYQQYIAAVAVIVLSAVTDVVDGRIARKYNMVSDFGKVLDPLADKLTQAAMLICLTTRYKAMLALVLLMAVKESVLLICGWLTLKSTDTVNSARWYGKVSTATIYAVMIVLFLFPDIPLTAVRILMLLCAVVLCGSMLLYGRFYYKILKEKSSDKHTEIF